MIAILKLIRWGVTSLFALFFVGILVVAGAYIYVAPDMPEVDSLREVHLQVPLRVYSRDGLLIAEYGEQRREPLRLQEVPERMVQAFLAAEDDRFYSHPGVDYQGLLRAAHNLMTTGERSQGGSTITMQLARNFFLSRDRTYTRKLTEIFLALRIERELSKDEILELYLNKIYLGQRAYGVAAAAQVYYGATVDDLTLDQIAVIAGLPKAPSAANPVTSPRRAEIRRNYVLGRMHSLGWVTSEDYRQALQAPVAARLHHPVVQLEAPFVGEMVRQEMVARHGDAAYTDGFRVYTTLDSRMQRAGNDALRQGLIGYDRRHGYRGPEARIDLSGHADEGAWDEVLSRVARVGGRLWPGIVIQVEEGSAEVYMGAGSRVSLDLDAVSWARPYINVSRTGDAPTRLGDVLSPGDLIRVERASGDRERWVLGQVPAVGGALVAMDPDDGALQALVGGFDFYRGSFNRAVQAERQPGSAFKPFLYSASLERGYSPASLINDAPVVFEDAALEDTWRPTNYSGQFYGPTRLRDALAQSRNLVSIRLLHAIGVGYGHGFLSRFGFDLSRQPRNLSLALGSGTVTPMEMAAAYAVFANGGYRVDPWFIERIEGPDGEPLLQAAPRRVCDPPCDSVVEDGAGLTPVDHDGHPVTGDPGATPLPLIEPAERVLSPANAYQMVSMMRDVIQEGTGRRARQLGRADLAGKTGTTNDLRDAWFSGFNRDVVTTVWLGFDDNSPLGPRETGGVVALPIWVDFMGVALDGRPERSLPQPEGMVTVRIDAETGRLASSGSRRTIFETFTPEQVPEGDPGGRAASRDSRSGESDSVRPESLF
ncbi:penicillin-binding protein 1A [Thioalkalivibrio thiocyanodenitrificans]|uniref:penicillin-binding protein 1A n=1 Tax=Thioalkalivibrio thiocyanodenitrificans TaxID=243063 RepID=UPI00036B4ED5|nr:penicillin-binding protein 1A [Thioalkalivibrio thiocyanodenitrificans]